MSADTGRRRVIAQQWISVDGFAAGPTDENDIFAAVPDFGLSERHNTALLPGVDTVVLGRRSYESFVAFWPTDAAREQPMAPWVNGVAKIVCSTTLAEAPWPGHTPAQVVADAVAHLRDLREIPGGHLLIWGSLALMRALLDEDLVDEMDLFVAPVALGGGTPLITPGRPLPLRLIDEARSENGCAHLRYALS